MPTPRTSIDDLPAKDPPEADDRLVIQDSGVTKHTTVGGLLTLPSGALTAHLNNTTDAHDASAISSVDAGNGVNGANVQAQLGQLSSAATNASSAAAAADAKIVTHMAAALDAHDASAISAIAGAILTGLDVQAQLTQIEAALAGGTVGPEGPEGPAGPGVPTGGTAGQLLSKIDANDFSSQWISPLWLPLAGGTLTGKLNLNAGAQLNSTAGAATSLDVFIGATRQGFFGKLSSDQMAVGAVVGDFGLLAGNAIKATLTSLGLIINDAPTLAGHATRKDYVDALAGARVAVAGDVMTGNLTGPYFGVTAAQSANGSSLTRRDYVDGQINGRVSTAGDTITGTLTIPASPSVGAGVQILVDGRIYTSVCGQTYSNVYLGRGGSPSADPGGKFLSFFRGASVGAPLDIAIGSVSIATGGSSVLYNTTSDERLKTFTREVDDEEALAAVRAMHPKHFTWNNDPDSGEQIGFFAQELYEVAPEAVSIGEGEPDDPPDPETGEPGFTPWGTDLTRLVPRIVAAMQAMDNKMAAMRTEIAELRGQLGTQPA